MVQQWVKARRKSYLVVGREVSRRSDIVSCGFLEALDHTALTARVSATATPQCGNLVNLVGFVKEVSEV